MERFIESIRKALESKNWFSALFMALTLPDICGALENHGKASPRKYKDWFDRYLRSKYEPNSRYESIQAWRPEIIRQLGDAAESLKNQPIDQEIVFTADDCYRARCKCLHQGLLEKSSGQQFDFITPPPYGAIIHGNIFNGVFQLQIDVFCEDVCTGVEEWLRDVASDDQIQSGIEQLMQINHYSTLEPFIKFQGT